MLRQHTVSQLHSLVFCHLMYCPFIWAVAAKKDIHKLQMVQNRAARLALQCSIRTNTAYMHSRLSWFSVETQLHFCLLMFFRKVVFNQTPVYFFNQLQYTFNRHNHNTRNASLGQLIPPTPRTNLLKRTVIYLAITAWNLLPPRLTHMSNNLSFKKQLKAHLRTFTT